MEYDSPKHHKKSYKQPKKIISNLTRSSDNISIDDIEHYKGIKSENSSAFNSSDVEIIDQKSSKRKESEITVPTLFEWKEGGNTVLLTGSFCNWNERFMMEKNYKTDNFEFTIDLPLGQYEYKFIVDNKFRYSACARCTTDENGNRINYIDNTKDYYEKQEKEKNNLYKNEARRGGTLVKKKKKQYESNTDNILEFSGNFGNKFPKKEFFRDEPPAIPKLFGLYMNINLNTRQNQIGNKKYLQKKKLTMNDCFKNIRHQKHIYYNHILTPTRTYGISNVIINNKLLVKNKSNDSSFDSHSENSEKETNYHSKSLNSKKKKEKEGNYIKSCVCSNISVRVKAKLFSIIYYKPLKSKKTHYYS